MQLFGSSQKLICVEIIRKNDQYEKYRSFDSWKNIFSASKSDISE